MKKRSIPKKRRRRGATMILIALMMVMLLAMVAFAVDVGRMYATRSQLQTAVDAGALAAGLQLREDSDDIAAAVAAGEDFVQQNRVGSFVTVPKDAIVVETGTWDKDTRLFTAGTVDADAVRVRATLDQEPFFFGKVLGNDTFAVPRAAISYAGGNPLDIIMTLDLSGSMKQQGRIDALNYAAPIFVDIIQEVGDDDRIGVMGYGAIPNQYDPAAQGHTGVSYLETPASLFPDPSAAAGSDWVAVKEADLTYDLDYIRDGVLASDTLVADKYNGWTPIGAALRDSVHYLATNARNKVGKIIVLMSDGHANKPAGNARGYALDMAHYALQNDITVYTISLGNAADEDLMQQIADVTGGEHFVAYGSGNGLAQKLRDAFARVAKKIKETQLVQ
ncbi:MAG: TadE/TadG family protein [Planctomycetales bacterium]|nr:TadE/TadG family protein [Planctomycetales bacterium]